MKINPHAHLFSGGVFDFCMIGFALGYPLKGAEARKKLAGK